MEKRDHFLCNMVEKRRKRSGNAWKVWERRTMLYFLMMKNMESENYGT